MENKDFNLKDVKFLKKTGTVVKSKNTTNVTMQAIWRHIWKRTVEKSQTNAASVTLHPIMQTIWEGIW